MAQWQTLSRLRQIVEWAESEAPKNMTTFRYSTSASLPVAANTTVKDLIEALQTLPLDMLVVGWEPSDGNGPWSLQPLNCSVLHAVEPITLRTYTGYGKPDLVSVIEGTVLMLGNDF